MKKQSPCGNRSTAKKSMITTYVSTTTTLYNYFARKKFQKKAFKLYMHSNFILPILVSSHFFQMFTPTSFVPTEIFPNVARTTPSSTWCPTPLFHFLFARNAGRTTTLNWTPFSFVVPTLISFRSKPNLMTMQGGVRFFFSRPFMSWSCVQLLY